VTGIIEAAGGVVVRSGPAGPEVLVVHRVRQDDWSLPKGHLDPGESTAEAAVREVAEEAGVACAIEARLGETSYVGPLGPKRVTWFLMRALAGDPAGRPADAEVDVARWVPAGELEGLMTYPSDLAQVRTALDLDAAR